MIKIGITGQNGFIGSHIYNTLGLYPEKYQRIDFHKECFENESLIDEFVVQCDVIIHLAAMNRHNDPNEIYKTNINLVEKLIQSLERTNQRPQIIFSSSTQEDKDNLYGKSKKQGRLLLENWAKQNDSIATCLIIPNVFGPFGHPFYNSVVATFCHQITHNETPKIDVDGTINLIYVLELVNVFLEQIEAKNNSFVVQHTATIKVSDLLKILQSYQVTYADKGEIPLLTTSFDYNLFNTFRCYMPKENYFPRKFKQNIDQRGAFVEIIRLGIGGQVSFSTTVPDVVRGNHFHTRKIERFAVIKGNALIKLRQIGKNEVLNFELNGDEPAYVDMPIWFTHNIKNIGKEELYTIFWINEPYNPEDADTYFENV
jgi:UDP-2-acetamido-2,6-beta-L-arabino-hexul-4-ose reductase